jgi:DNA-directed RNA polymerase specialized sigma54-like protein
MDFSQAPSVAPLQRSVPWLIAANAMLVLSSAELASLLAQEAAENPALELEEYPVCPRCGGPLQGAFCLDCVSLAPSSQLAGAENWQPESFWQTSGYEEDSFDETSVLPAPVDFRAQLCLALRAQLPSDDIPLL